MSAAPGMYWADFSRYLNDREEVCEDDEDEGGPLFAGEIGRDDGFRFVRAYPEASFAVEAAIPERPKQIVHGPQRRTISAMPRPSCSSTRSCWRW